MDDANGTPPVISGRSALAIRPAHAEEAAALADLCLRSKAHWGYDAAFMALAAPVLAVRPEWIARGDALVAAGDRPLAFAAIAPSEDVDGWDLASFFVDPEAMGQGVGRRLFAAAVALARRRGARSLSILADPNAAGFYERMGAECVGDAPSDAIPGRRLPVYRYGL